MPNKSKKKNSFYFFMKEMQERETAKGRKISMMDLPQIAHPIWARMSVAEKEPYDEMAKNYNNNPGYRGGKLASDGTRVEDNRSEIKDKERRDNILKQAVQNFVNSGCMSVEQFKEFAPRKLFYFISFNILCKTETQFYPNEVGLVEYSIQNGIHREYHRLIYPGRIPTGYAGEAKRLSEEHEIDIYGEDCSEKDLRKLFREIKTFTNPDNSEEFPPLFCIDEDIERNFGCLDYLAYCAREENCFEIWNASYLLLELRAGVNEELLATIASDLLTKTNFSYSCEARCEFHDEKDNHNCALAYSKRLCYLLSDAVCLQFDVDITERHMPALTSADKPYTVIVTNEQPTQGRHTYNPPLPLDSRSSYYSNLDSEDDPYSDIQSIVSSSATSAGHRQPASTCMSAQMASLKLNMTPATAPGHGIGRGQRR